jgi:hypothetical protein
MAAYLAMTCSFAPSRMSRTTDRSQGRRPRTEEDAGHQGRNQGPARARRNPERGTFSRDNNLRRYP